MLLKLIGAHVLQLHNSNKMKKHGGKVTSTVLRLSPGSTFWVQTMTILIMEVLASRFTSVPLYALPLTQLRTSRSWPGWISPALMTAPEELLAIKLSCACPQKIMDTQHWSSARSECTSSPLMPPSTTQIKKLKSLNLRQIRPKSTKILPKLQRPSPRSKPIRPPWRRAAKSAKKPSIPTSTIGTAGFTQFWTH